MQPPTFATLYDDTELYDDASRFRYASAIVEWGVPRTSSGIAFANEMRKRLRPKSGATPFEWLCWLVLLAKYGAADEILKTTFDGKKLAREPFLARQRTAVLTRCLAIEPKTVIREWRAETAAG